MATQALISPEEYLRTSYEGIDREYAYGAVVERSMPTYIHGRIQILLGYLFEVLRRQHPVYAAAEVRHPLRPNELYRIPDVAVYVGQPPTGNYPDSPPFVAIEILSPEDRMGEVLKKFAEYQAWGVDNIWLIDPQEKKFYTYDATALRHVPTLDLPRFSFQIALADLDLN